MCVCVYSIILCLEDRYFLRLKRNLSSVHFHFVYVGFVVIVNKLIKHIFLIYKNHMKII